MKKKNLLMTAVAIIGFATITIAQPVPSYVPTTGLVGWWPFNGNANDESGSGNNGTVNGSTLTTDRFGNTNKSYSFDGVNDFIEIAYNNSLNNSTGSVSAWIKTNGLLSNNQMLIYGQGQGRPTICVNSSNNHKARLQWHQQLSGSPNGWAMVTSLSNIDNSQWVNIVGVYDTIMLKIYINGVLESNYISSYTQWNCSNYNYHIGGFNATSISCGGSLGISQVFNGKIDDIGVWNRALTQEEITSIYYGSSIGVNEISQFNLFSVFPNPAQNEINVNLDPKLVGSLFAIYDNTGKAVKTGKINSENTTIEISDLSGGIYTFSVGENKKQTFKVIKE